MSATLVTAFFPRPSGQLPSRSILHYLRYGYELLSLGIPTVLYVPMELVGIFAGMGPHVKVRHWHYDDFWARRYDASPLPCTDNPAKDTAEYHVIQHQKTEFLAHASRHGQYDRYVWVDFGIFYVPYPANPTTQVDGPAIERMYARAKNDLSPTVVCPSGNLTLASRPYEPTEWHVLLDHQVQWQTLGGVLSCHRDLCESVQDECRRQLDASPLLTFEVNTWAKVAKIQNWRLYQANHDCSLFDNYPGAP
jgi:hypothetical protein